MLALAALLALTVPGITKAKPGPLCPTAIPANMVDYVKSADARIGMVFRFETTSAATVEGETIPVGTRGYGVVRAASSAGRRNRNGMLTLDARYLALPKGQRVDVMMDPHLPIDFNPATTLIDRGIGMVPNPIPGLAMTVINYERYGKNITIGPGFLFHVIPVADLATGQPC